MDRGFRIRIYKADRRTKKGERWFGDYDYPTWDEQSIQNEIRHLQQHLYPKSQGWRLELEPLTVTVRNMMSGEPVVIDSREAGGPCDPSTERYWSM